MNLVQEDLVGTWEVALPGGIHVIQFEHGTTTGKRVIHVDGIEVLRKEWMFKLVGEESFTFGASNAKGKIMIESVSGFTYGYSLMVNDKTLRKFVETQSKAMKAWHVTLEGIAFRVAMEKDTLDVWVNGDKVETAGEFTESGTETHFGIGDHSAYIQAVSSGNRREGILHTLIVDDREIPETYDR